VVDYGSPVERLLTVEFGPSRSKRFAKAVAEARGGAVALSQTGDLDARTAVSLQSFDRRCTLLRHP
jgi:hypothetical protein